MINEEKMRKKLRDWVKQFSNTRAFAKKLKYTEHGINHMLAGRRPVCRLLAKKLGYCKVSGYVKVSRKGKRA